MRCVTGTGYGHSTCLPVTLLAPVADCCVSLHYLGDLAGAALRHLAVLLAEVLSSSKTSLALLIVQVYVLSFCGS